MQQQRAAKPAGSRNIGPQEACWKARRRHRSHPSLVPAGDRWHGSCVHLHGGKRNDVKKTRGNSQMPVGAFFKRIRFRISPWAQARQDVGGLAPRLIHRQARPCQYARVKIGPQEVHLVGSDEDVKKWRERERERERERKKEKEKEREKERNKERKTERKREREREREKESKTMLEDGMYGWMVICLICGWRLRMNSTN